MVATRTRYTLADLLEQAGDDYNLYEIWGGELVVLASPDDPHAAVVMELLDLLLEAQRAGFGRARTAPRAVAFDYGERGLQAQDVTQPDVLFVVEARRSILWRCVKAAPDLVIEVLSPSTRAHDMPGGRKFAIYERYGVPHYWIVDVEARTITQYAWRDGRYGEPTVLRPGDTRACPLFPGLTRSVDAIFAGIL